MSLQRLGTGGGIHRSQPWQASRIFWSLILLLILSALALSLASIPLPEFLGLPPSPGRLLPFLGAALLAWLAALGLEALLRRRLSALPSRRFSRLLVHGESLLVIQAPLDGLREPLAELSASGDIPPALFVFPLDRGVRGPSGEALAGAAESPLSAAQLQEHARSLAAGHGTALRGSGLGAFVKLLESSRRRVQDACLRLGEASRLQRGLPLTAEWLLDNEYIFESNARDLRINLTRRSFRRLPVLSRGSWAGLPRVYALAKELLFQTGFLVGEENIAGFLSAYQESSPLSLGELWAFPQMLRIVVLEAIALISAEALRELDEQETANYWANRLITANRRDPRRFFEVMSALSESQAEPSAFFATQLVDYLYDEAGALSTVRGWLERLIGGNPAELALSERRRLARDQISIGNAFTSLRQLSMLDWKESFERLSRVESLLSSDPAGVYPRMDFPTRDLYRHAVEELSLGSGLPEPAIAAMAVDLAKEASQGEEAPPAHLGEFLIGESRRRLARLCGTKEGLRYRILSWTRRRHALLYFPSLAFLSAGLCALAFLASGGAAAGAPAWAFALLALLPSSQFAMEIINGAVTRLIPPQALPKMDYAKGGIPDSSKTLVVVPMMLSDRATIRAEAEKLEIRFLANPDSRLSWGLFADYKDSSSPKAPNDEEFLGLAEELIRVMGEKHGPGRFYLFHRERRWSESERAFIGWERKRGKLEELNDLISGRRPAGAEDIVRVGDREALSEIRFVITLDSDNQLPPGSAARLVGTMDHPLNRPRLGPDGSVASGFGIVQPRVSSSLPSSSATPFSRLFSDPEGMDPYTHMVSDAYQDLCGEGSYQGKGIYDPRLFSRVLSGRFPEATLLSHDLVEGAYLRTAFASDIELFDEFPPDYLSWTRRAHRWTRGDWQIAAWALWRVPSARVTRSARVGRERNPLSPMNRWKVADNLRRSLVPLSDLALLAFSWALLPRLGIFASLMVFLQHAMHPLVQALGWASSSRIRKALPLKKILHGIARSAAEIALLPHRALQSADAILRALWRMAVSRRKLLQWTPAQAMHRKARSKVPAFVRSLLFLSLLLLSAGTAALLLRPALLAQVLPWLVPWGLEPLLGAVLCVRPRPRRGKRLLSGADQRYLRSVARLTWRYFDDMVDESNSHLPPDNYQVSHHGRVAPRTSPTNIGLYLSGLVAAAEFGYLSADEAERRLSRSFDSLRRLVRHEGHLLNWYDTRDLSPLEPRFVSTVDSGNLLGALWALEGGLKALLSEPVLDCRAPRGLQDAGRLLRRAMAEEGASRAQLASLDRALRSWETEPPSLANILQALELARAPFPGGGAKAAYWRSKLSEQASDWLDAAQRYLSWLEPLSALAQARPALAASVTDALPLRAPSLRELAGGADIGAFIGAQSEGIALALEEARRDAEGTGELKEALERLDAAWDRAKWLAGEKLAALESLASAAEDLAAGVNMRFLYNAERRLFAIGYNVSEGRLDRVYYDLLASEARLGSFVAIARGDVSAEHWFSMGRPYGAIGRRRALMSWTGTMFEYLMPALFQKTWGLSLLDKAAREAIAIHIAHGRRAGLPWGISECAYGDLDAQKNYQYQAFGVPDLALKRGMPEKAVIAPYATLLALPFAPKEALANLRRLEGLGLLSDYGFFEALDLSREPGRESSRGIVVRAYMAHHQGMGFLALSNLLHDGRLQRIFHADPRVRMAEPLLQERIPHMPPLHHVSTRYRLATAAPVAEAAPVSSEFDSPHGSTPKTQLLSNGRYSLMVTNAGGGWSRWGDMDIGRWRADTTRDADGFFCYLRDLDSGRLWSNAHHPVGAKADQYGATFSLDRVLFRRSDADIVTETEIIVAPEDDVEIRRITLVNRSPRVRRIALTSYLELAMAPHAADRQHPAFNKLFIQTEALPEREGLLAFRRPRGGSEAPVFVVHRLTEEPGQKGSLPFAWETDRRRFIGRGRDLSAPMGASQQPGLSQGFVLDPVLSIRKEFSLGIGERRTISLVVGASAVRDGALGILDRYSDPRAVDRAMDFAWASAQLELRLLRIQAEDARRYQQLASHLIYPAPLLRASSRRIAENRKGQSGLWAYAISGDLPIVLLSIAETQDLALVRQVLQAHAFWRLRGLKADLVILNEETAGYEQPLKEELERLIQGWAPQSGRDCPGGIFLRASSMIPEEDLALLRAAASVSLVAARGTLSQQLTAPYEEGPSLPEPFPRRKGPKEPAAALPFMNLHYFNSLGGFSQDGREYVIYLGPGMNTPAPWINVMANPSFGAIVSETGAGFSWRGNSQRNRLTGWSNDPVTDPHSEALYLRDEESGLCWSPTAGPLRDEWAYRARHGAGYTVFEHNGNGLDQELTVFVPMDSGGGLPAKVQRLRLRNDTDRQRRISLSFYAEWTLGEQRESSSMHVVSSWDEASGALFAHNRYHPEEGGAVAFASLYPPPSSYTADRTVFLGRNRSLKSPAGLERASLSRRVGAGLDPCAALQTVVKLAPGETREFVVILGQAASAEEARRVMAALREPRAAQEALQRTIEWWDEKLDALRVRTPELAVDLLVNRWLPYQALSCRMWGRSGFYQSGGAFGFRDQLQDSLALLYGAPEITRAQILLAASRQFREGDVQHWWHPPAGAGIRSRISDDLLWLPFAAAEYLRVSGDASILDEAVPFLEAPLLAEGQHESFQSPAASPERASLFEHCRRAVGRVLGLSGEHGLPLMGTGDWNDGMNLVGAEGRGESVWLAWFLAEVLRGMAEMAEAKGLAAEASESMRERESLLLRTEGFAWDGDWYLRATFDDGSPLGSASCQEAQIDSLSQSWAVLAGAPDQERAGKALQSAWDRLVRHGPGIVLLFDPPFDRGEPSPGYIRGYPPGVRENGGQYTHAAVWLAMAFARRGEGERAAAILRMINPVEHARDPESTWRYAVEPYVATADVYDLPGLEGQGGWSWYTGSAAWMYRAWMSEVLGLRVRGSSMTLDPSIPASWEGFRLSYRRGEALYEIVVDNPRRVSHGLEWVELDGQRMEGGVIPLEEGAVKHRVVLRMG